MSKKTKKQLATEQCVLGMLEAETRLDAQDFSIPERSRLCSMKREGLIEYVRGAWQKIDS